MLNVENHKSIFLIELCQEFEKNLNSSKYIENAV